MMRNRYIDDALVPSGIPIDQAAIIDAIARRDFTVEASRLVLTKLLRHFLSPAPQSSARTALLAL